MDVADGFGGTMTYRMTADPTPPGALESASAPREPRRSIVPVIIAWLVILAVVGVIVVAGLRPKSVESADHSPSRTASTQLLIQSRIAVGFNHLASGKTGTSLVHSIDRPDELSAADRLRVTAVVGELGGKDAVLERLDELEKKAKIPADATDFADALRVVYAKGPGAADATARERLASYGGWFGQLALTHGLPDDDPTRRAALAPAVRAAGASIAILALGGFGLVVGLVILVIALVAAIDGKVPRRYRPPPPGRSGPFVEAFALYMLGMIVASAVLYRLIGKSPSLAANFWIALALPLPLIWPRLRGLTWPEIRTGFGWHAGRGVVREAVCGVVGYVAGIPLLIVALLVTSVLSKLFHTTPSHPIVGEAGQGGGIVHVLLLYGLAAVFAPLAEETMFRGALFHHCRRGLPWWLSALIVALIFAAIHPQGVVGIPLLATIAIVLAALREWRGSLIAPIVCHACVNAVTVTMLVMMTG
jgi:membrane protease YdiL (CAAX protease family)